MAGVLQSHDQSRPPCLLRATPNIRLGKADVLRLDCRLPVLPPHPGQAVLSGRASLVLNHTRLRYLACAADVLALIAIQQFAKTPPAPSHRPAGAGAAPTTSTLSDVKPPVSRSTELHPSQTPPSVSLRIDREKRPTPSRALAPATIRSLTARLSRFHLGLSTRARRSAIPRFRPLHTGFVPFVRS